MAGNRYLEKTTTGDIKQRASIQITTGAPDAGKLIAANQFGFVDPSFIQGETVQDYVASENIDAGDLINVWNDAGTAKVRKATNTSAATRAHGFSPSSVLAAANGTFYLWKATIGGLSGLTPGERHVLGTNGDVLLASSAPTADGTIVQNVGVAKTATEFEFFADQTIIINDSAT